MPDEGSSDDLSFGLEARNLQRVGEGVASKEAS